MSYLIYDIQKVSSDQFESYFFDANSWIIAIKLSNYSSEHIYEKKYADFFDAVINSASLTDPKLIKKLTYQPTISITSMLISELINAYMRRIAMRMWFDKEGGDYKQKNFKDDYRTNKQTDYNKQLKSLINDIASYKDFTKVIDDDFKNIDPFTFINDLSDSCDFNDLYYYYRFIESKTCIVTDDADFLFQDIPIVTGNPKLLKLSSI